MNGSKFPVDIGSKLNVQKTRDVFWTSYVRSIYVLRLLGYHFNLKISL